MVALVAGRQLSISCPHPTSLCSATFPKGEGFGGEGKALVYNAEWLHCRKGGVGDAFRFPRDGKPVPYGALPKMRVILRLAPLAQDDRGVGPALAGASLCPTKVIKIISGRGALVRLVRYLRGSMNSVWAGPSTKGL